MHLKTTTEPLEDIKAEMLLVTIFEGEKELKGRLAWLDRILAGHITKLLKTNEVQGKYKEFALLHTTGIGADRILIIGMGKKEDFSIDRIRSVVAIAARNTRRIHAKSLAVDSFAPCGISAHESARAIVEGIVLGLYKFTKYMGEGAKKYEDTIGEVIIADQDEANLPLLEAGFKEGEALSKNANFVRDLVNEPANTLTPAYFAEVSERVAKEAGIAVTILDEKAIQDMGMGAFWAVAKASENPPRLVDLRYEGNPGGKWIGLVGKGITFDSGGLNIKTGDNMSRMHCDMAGAGAVLGAIATAAEMKLPVNCHAVMPLCENMPGSRAYKEGDILKSLEGKTIEILNTDAEGRLILADALTYTYKKGVEYLVDIATLTGGIVIALGHHLSGIMGNDQELVDILFKSGETTGERLWQLPLYKEFATQLRSDVADIENSGGRPASSITAAAFLKAFVGDTKWAHIDIAGTATIDAAITLYVRNPYVPKEGATAVGVRLLYQFLKDGAEVLKKKAEQGDEPSKEKGE
ncbi:MAG: leucyl aminopeptidase [Candidatus Eremiobacteraeota bacterium]|nr:leucyl aminopeptidase [Candidatus Eremiobacteraeota bacterium]